MLTREEEEEAEEGGGNDDDGSCKISKSLARPSTTTTGRPIREGKVETKD